MRAPLIMLCLATAAASAPMQVRGWQLHDPNPAYCRKAIMLAPDYGINHVQLSHGIVHYADDLLAEPERAELVDDLAALAHQSGLEVVMWTHELHDVPAELMRDGRVNFDDDALWEWLQEKYRKVFQSCPSVDGIVLSLHETSSPVYDDTKVDSILPKAERVTKLVRQMYLVCHEAGKTLYVRTFAYMPDELQWLIEGLRAAPDDVRIMSKCVPHDWQPAYPDNPAIGAFPGKVQIVEFDLGQEYYGSNALPFDETGYLKKRLSHAVGRGCKGAVARIDRGKRHCLGTVNEFNLKAFSLLVSDPYADLDGFWKEYCTETYGAEAAPYVERALRRTFDIVKGMYLCFGYSFMSDHSRIPDHGYSQWILHFHSNAKWDPRKAIDHIRLLAPDAVVIAQAMSEKDAARKLLDSSLADLSAAKEYLDEATYDKLYQPFARLDRCLSLWRALLDCYLWQKVFAGYPTVDHRRIVQEKIEAVRSVAEQVEAAVGEDEFPDSAKRARIFADQVEKSAEELVPYSPQAAPSKGTQPD